MLFTISFICGASISFQPGVPKTDQIAARTSLQHFAELASIKDWQGLEWKAVRGTGPSKGWTFDSGRAFLTVNSDGDLTGLLLRGLASEPDGPKLSKAAVESAARSWTKKLLSRVRGAIELRVTEGQMFSVSVHQKVDGYWTYQSTSALSFRQDGRLSSFISSGKVDFVPNKVEVPRDAGLKAARTWYAATSKEPLEKVAYAKLSDIKLMWCRPTALQGSVPKRPDSKLFLGWVVPLEHQDVLVDASSGTVRGAQRR